jgi:hypothetical protein
MKIKKTICSLVLAGACLVMIETRVMAQDSTARAKDREVLHDLKSEKTETQVNAKEARRVERDATTAARESKNAYRSEKKAQKARKQADRQGKKAVKARATSDNN